MSTREPLNNSVVSQRQSVACCCKVSCAGNDQRRNRVIQKIPGIQTWLLIFSLLLWPGFVDAQTLGRIITTAQERQYLDRQRAAMFAALSDSERELALSAPVSVVSSLEAEPTIIHMGGSIRRSDGSHSVWLNGVAVSESDLPSNARLEFTRGLGVLRIRTATGELTVRPGQTLNATTGELREDYQLSAERVTEINAELARRAEANRPVVTIAAPAADAEVKQPESLDATLSTMESIVESLRLLQEANQIQDALQ